MIRRKKFDIQKSSLVKSDVTCMLNWSIPELVPVRGRHSAIPEAQGQDDGHQGGGTAEQVQQPSDSLGHSRSTRQGRGQTTSIRTLLNKL